MEDVIKSDIRFGRQILGSCLVLIVIDTVLATALPLDWWLSLLVFGWVGFGLVSVMVQVLTDFGYLRMAPRADVVISFTMSTIAGPLSLARVLFEQIRKPQ